MLTVLCCFSYFASYIDVPEITEDIFDYGLFNVYQCFNYDTPNARKVPLPAPLLLEDKTDPQNPVYYTEQIDYEYGIGWVKLFFIVSDFFYEKQSFTPQAMDFRAIIAYCQ